MRKMMFKPVILLAAVAAVGAIVMLLWNYIVPTVIGWGTLSYFQAVGLLILARLLFGGFGGFQKKSLSHKERMNCKEQLKGMSRDERKEYIRDYMSKRDV